MFLHSLFYSEPGYGRPSNSAGILSVKLYICARVISTPQILCENVLRMMLRRDLSLLQTNSLVQHTVWLQSNCMTIFNLHKRGRVKRL